MEDNQQNKQVKTYLALASKDDTNASENMIEFDLTTARHKGEEIRYFYININNLNNGKVNEFGISLDEQGFNELKSFFSKLEWNS